MKTASSLSALLSLLFATSCLAADATKPAGAPRSIPDELGFKGFNTLKAAVMSAGLADALSAPGPFTVFAPTDGAFAKLPKGKLDALLQDKEKLAALLKGHVVEGKIASTDIKAGELKPLAGADLKLSVAADSVKVNDAKVVKKDLAASNGVIHGIDMVLMP